MTQKHIFVILDKLLSIRTFSVNVLSLWTNFYQIFVIYQVLIRTCFCQFDHCFLVVPANTLPQAHAKPIGRKPKNNRNIHGPDANPSSLHTTLEGPTEYVHARWM